VEAVLAVLTQVLVVLATTHLPAQHKEQTEVVLLVLAQTLVVVVEVVQLLLEAMELAAPVVLEVLVLPPPLQARL
jgi:hypothetical protein